MKEIVIDRDQLNHEMQSLRKIVFNATSESDLNNMVLVPVSKLEYAINCMERLNEVFELSAREIANIDDDDPEDKLLAAYEELGLTNKE